MAFFKFRQRGQPQDLPRGRASQSAAGAQETVDSLRRRARHRLLGALVLVLVAVIGFPLLFDTQPRPVTVDAPIIIPDQENAPPLRVPPVRSPANTASRPASAPTVVPALPVPPGSATSAMAPAQASASTVLPAASHAAAPASPARPAVAPAASVASAATQREPAPAASRRAEEQERARRAAQEEEARVRALLSGQTPPPPKAASPASAASSRFIVQVGAFADANKVRQVRQQAERAGLKTYVQVIDTQDGKRTRVRAGPYASRAEAERAAAALRKAGLSGSILTL